MGVQSTDEPTLKALIETTIVGITPTLTNRQALKWRKRDRRATPSQATRTFHVEFAEYDDSESESAGFTTASMVNEIRVSVVTDYSLPHQEVMPLVFADHRQLLRTLSDLKKTDSNGVWWVESLGTSDLPEDSSADHFQVDHDFLFRYQTSGSF